MSKDDGELAKSQMSRRINGLCQWKINEAVTAGWDGLWDAASASVTLLIKIQ